MRKSAVFALAILASAGLSASQVQAQAQVQNETPQERYIRQLGEQGFVDISVTRTWLGRVRIRAFSDTMEREIVLNPNSGEILRDYTEKASGGSADGSHSIFGPASDGTNGGDEDTGRADGSGGSGGGGGFDYLNGGFGADINFRATNE